MDTVLMQKEVDKSVLYQGMLETYLRFKAEGMYND